MKKILIGFTVIIEKDKATGYFVGEVAKVNDINFREISLCEC